MDIDAYVGVLAVLATSKGARVDAYEPYPGAFCYLTANARRWPGLTASQSAVVGSSVESTGALFIDPDGTPSEEDT